MKPVYEDFRNSTETVSSQAATFYFFKPSRE